MNESSPVRPPNQPMERAGSAGRSSAARYVHKFKPIELELFIALVGCLKP